MQKFVELPVFTNLTRIVLIHLHSHQLSVLITWPARP